MDQLTLSGFDAQVLLAILLVFLSWAIARRLDRREFFIWWTWGWATFAAALIGFRIPSVLELTPPQEATSQIFVTPVALLQVTFFYLGAQALRKQRDIAAGRVKMLVGGTIALGLGIGILAWPFHSGSEIGWTLRTVGREAGLAAVFPFCAYAILEHESRRPFPVSTALMALGFFVWGVNQLLYTAASFSGLLSAAVGVAPFPFLQNYLFTSGAVAVDIACQAVIGLGSVLLVLDQAEALTERMIEQSKMEAVGRLAGGVAHDFNNLLTSIRGPLDLALLEVQEDGELREDLLMARESTDRAGRLTRQLLIFAQKQPIRPTLIDLNEKLEDGHDFIERVTSGSSKKLRMELDGTKLPVRIDPIQLEQVVLNLVMNASDATEDGGTVWIRTRRSRSRTGSDRSEEEGSPSRWAVIEVEDTGTGMDEETVSRAVEPYFTTREQGTGIGLAVVHGAVADAGGSLEIDSKPGRGTRMRVALPLAD